MCEGIFVSEFYVGLCVLKVGQSQWWVGCGLHGELGGFAGVQGRIDEAV